MKKLKKHKIIFIISIILIGIAFGLLIGGVIEETRKIEFTYLNDLIKKETNNVYKNAYLNVYTIPFGFAEYDNTTSKFYIVKDNNYLYIAYLDEAVINGIMETDDLERKPYKVVGYTKRIPEDVKELAIEAYNELYKEEVVNKENFESYFGSIYLTTEDGHSNSEFWYFAAFTIAVLGLYGLYITKIKK